MVETAPVIRATASTPTAGLASQVPAVAITPKEIIGIFRRRIWLIVIITIISTLTAGVIWFLERRYHPKYTSTGLVRCLMPVQPDILAGNQPLPSEQLIALQTQSRALELKSDAFLSRVLQRAEVQATAWFKSYGDDQVRRMDDFKKDFSAQPVRDSEFIVVSMMAGNSQEAKNILNHALALFSQEMTSNAESGLKNDQLALQRESDRLQKDISAKRFDLNRLRSEIEVPGWEKGQSSVSQEIAALQMEKLRLQSLLQESLSQKKLLEQNPGQSPRVAAAVEQDPIVAQFKSRILRLNEELDQLLGKFGEDHQMVKEGKLRIQTVQQQLNDYQQQLQQQYAGAEQGAVDRDVQTLQQQIDSVSEQFDRASATQKDIETRLANYLMAKDELDVLNKNLERFTEKIDAISVGLRTEGRARIQISEGNDPIEMSYPRLAIFIPAGFMLGLLISVGLILAIEFLDDSVKTPSDVSRHLHIPMLGMVPNYDQEEDDAASVAKLAADQPFTLFSDSYRHIRTNLFFTAPAAQLRSVVISSAAPQCGTTVTAVNLAITLASENKKILLVDVNFRRPAIAKLFGLQNNADGLSSLLVGRIEPDQAIQSSGISGLDILPAGPLPPSPADLIDTRAMHDFIQRQSLAYDHLIFDCPPSLLFSDAGILAGLCAGTMLVVRANETSRGMVQRMLRELHKPNIRILGVVLNAVKPRKGGYFEKTLESYNTYTEANQTPPVLAAASTQKGS